MGWINFFIGKNLDHLINLEGFIIWKGNVQKRSLHCCHSGGHAQRGSFRCQWWFAMIWQQSKYIFGKERGLSVYQEVFDSLLLLGHVVKVASVKVMLNHIHVQIHRSQWKVLFSRSLFSDSWLWMNRASLSWKLPKQTTTFTGNWTLWGSQRLWIPLRYIDGIRAVIWKAKTTPNDWLKFSRAVRILYLSFQSICI